MRPLRLEGHYGRDVAVDLCGPCHQVWFDTFESVHLSGLGWVLLLRQMQTAPYESPVPGGRGVQCPRCDTPLKTVSNLTRHGRFAARECPRCRGHLQSFALLLAERGLVRPLTRRDLATLTSEHRTPTCLNCGGPIHGPAGRCNWCDSPLLVLDMPRLLAALLTRHAQPLAAEATQRLAWHCRGCGAALEPTQTTSCPRCDHPVVVPSIVDLRPMLDQAEPLLRVARPREAQPHGAKLRALRGDHRATGAHRYLREILDMGGRRNTSVDWIGLVLLGLFLWWLFG